MSVTPLRDSYDLTSGLRDRMSDGVRPDPVAVVPELQRLAREHLSERIEIREGQGGGAIDIRVHAWSVGRVRRSARQQQKR